MINYNAVGFSERRSEEVISVFWRSAYVKYADHQISGTDPRFSNRGGGGRKVLFEQVVVLVTL